MLKKYDSNQSSWVDAQSVKKYDTTQQSWVDATSVKVYDTTEQAWVEKFYQGYFTLRQEDGDYPQLVDGDELQINPGNITLYTVTTGLKRHVCFDLPYVWNNDLVEFDLTNSGIAKVYFGRRYHFGEAGRSGGPLEAIFDFYEGHISVQINEKRPDEQDGLPVTSSELYIQIDVAAADAGNMNAYVSVSNVRINGKPYGFAN